MNKIDKIIICDLKVKIIALIMSIDFNCRAREYSIKSVRISESFYFDTNINFRLQISRSFEQLSHAGSISNISARMYRM